MVAFWLKLRLPVEGAAGRDEADVAVADVNVDALAAPEAVL